MHEFIHSLVHSLIKASIHLGLTKIVKTKPRRLVLMNDLLMSVEAERKDPEDAVALQVGLRESKRQKR